MSTTTQILFNSPALHALRRDQLLRLCKIHGLRPQGRNDELIHRLKQHADALYADPPTNDNDNDDDDDDSEMMPRESEQWELMDTIDEAEESSSHGSLSSLKSMHSAAAGEFGTVPSRSKSSSVSSSIRALANSFRKHSTFPGPTPALPPLVPVPEPEKPHPHAPATSYSTPPPSPPTLSFDLGCETSDLPGSVFPFPGHDSPIPGHASRPGRPAPFDARLSLGNHCDAATTTVRLITTTTSTFSMSPPRIAPYQTTFDLLPASPGGVVWPPASPVKSDAEGIYPSLQFARVTTDNNDNDDEDEDTDMPGAFGASAATNTNASSATTNTNTTNTMPTEPFIFGSPSPKHRVSNAQFQAAAASVLEEMTRRLGHAPALDVLHNNNRSGEVRWEERAGKEERFGVRDKFDRAHEREFEKMDSIAGYAARRAGAGGVAKPAGTSRFGLLSTAKSIVKNVWNKGSGSGSVKAKAPASSAASVKSQASKSGSVSSSASSVSSTGPSKTASRPRLPIPNFTAPAATASVKTLPTAASAKTLPTAASAKSLPTAANAKSLPTAANAKTLPSAHKRTDSGSSVTSLGARTRAPASTGAKRSSTLYAPTASSLAKQSMRVPWRSRTVRVPWRSRVVRVPWRSRTLLVLW
ncbi:hypothetical protein NEOLEDRAFT_911871 [Neolentinus lepideus HHB14362 ss-1]|uniref:SAP domain-containing protein n=1 Tax=Neolentinus lepideus HHB14362 ss-1 TaxID=1314782 RepID=A0A165UK13_9AGAM|nr:hypothetical protein NEOLEDRAFT_911871 [Neolentinus lepideus HHB14362 ss-1]